MNIKLFYKTQRELSDVLNQLIDKYWGNEVDEDELIKNINNLYINNPGKMKKGEKYTTILQQICGKRRLEVIGRILKMTDNANNLSKDKENNKE